MKRKKARLLPGILLLAAIGLSACRSEAQTGETEETRIEITSEEQPADGGQNMDEEQNVNTGQNVDTGQNAAENITENSAKEQLEELLPEALSVTPLENGAIEVEVPGPVMGEGQEGAVQQFLFWEQDGKPVECGSVRIPAELLREWIPELEEEQRSYVLVPPFMRSDGTIYVTFFDYNSEQYEQKQYRFQDGAWNEAGSAAGIAELSLFAEPGTLEFRGEPEALPYWEDLLEQTGAERAETWLNSECVNELARRSPQLYPEKIYHLDLDGDGTMNQIRLQKEEIEYWTWQLSIWVDGEKRWDVPYVRGSAALYAADLTGTDGKPELLLLSESESNSLELLEVLQYKDGVFLSGGNLAGSSLNQSGDSVFRIQEIKLPGNGHLILDADTPIFDHTFGCYFAEVDFAWKDGKMELVPFESLKVEEQGHYEGSEFVPFYYLPVEKMPYYDTMERTGAAGTFEQGAELQILEIMRAEDGTVWAKMEDRAGVCGWVPALPEESWPDVRMFEELRLWG